MSLSRAHTVVAAIALSVFLLTAIVLNVVGLPIWLTAIIGLLLGAAAAWRLLSSADDSLLTAWNAQPIAAGTYPTLDNIVEGLCVSHGFALPDMYMVDTDARNAAVIAGHGNDSSMVLTRGLIESIGRMETEALMAHQLLVTRDTPVEDATLSARLVRLAPTLGSRRVLREYVLGDVDVFGGDWAGVQITRFPPGLVRAYQTLLEGSTEVAGVRPASAHLWLDDPGPAGPGVMTTTHPAMQDRIAHLREL